MCFIIHNDNIADRKGMPLEICGSVYIKLGINSFKLVFIIKFIKAACIYKFIAVGHCCPLSSVFHSFIISCKADKVIFFILFKLINLVFVNLLRLFDTVFLQNAVCVNQVIEIGFIICIFYYQLRISYTRVNVLLSNIFTLFHKL